MTLVRMGARLSGAHALRLRALASARKAGVVFVYHRVGDERGDPELEIDPGVSVEAFEGQLEHLRRHYRVVPASAIIQAARERRRGQRFPVAITFDDDLPSHTRHALPALRRAGCHATFFLSGGLAGSLWWEDLQRAIDGRLVQANALPHVAKADVGAALERSPVAIRRLASAIERLTPSQRREVEAALRAAVGPAESVLGSEDVRTLADAGFTIGFHTLRHDTLPPLSDGELKEALERGRGDLAATAGGRIDLIAYPHGKADRRVAEAARTAGFALGFTTTPTLVVPDAESHLIPRIVPASSAAAFALQLARTFVGRG